MKLYFHHCPAGFSNCYILGTPFPTDDDESPSPQNLDQPREAVLIDPGNMDATILGRIEDNNYTLRGVLVTHDHPHHVRGLKTIMRIYDVDIYAVNPHVYGYRTIPVKDRESFAIGPFNFEVITVPGHSTDSAVFKIDRFLFTGDALSAGLVGNTNNSYAAATQVSALRSKILSLPGDFTVLPGHGPPSSLEAERQFNLDLNSFELRKNRRQAFPYDFSRTKVRQ